MNKPNAVSAFCDDVLEDLDAVAIAQRIAKKEISATEAVNAAITRAKRVNPAINALISEQFAQAKQASQKPGKGLLAGVPSFIKDNEDVCGVISSHGSRAQTPKPAAQSSAFVEQFQSTGLISLGKTSMPEFGLTATTESRGYGVTRNPWNLGVSTGGSSGGSAAMVAAGVVPIAQGNDGGGSIRIPAACCGLVGLKPTRGRLINYKGTDSLPINLVQEGVLTRSVRDTEAFLMAAQQYYRNASLPPLSEVNSRSNKRLRIGFCTTGLSDIIVDAEVVTAVNKTAKLCEQLGHHVEELDQPFDEALADDFLVYWSMMGFAYYYFGGKLLGSRFNRAQVEPLTLGMSKYFRRNCWKLPLAIKRLRAFQSVYEQFLESRSLDLVLMPVVAQPAPDIGYLGPDVLFDKLLARLTQFAHFTGAHNISGAPAISLPLGMSAGHLPIGVQFSAPFGEDQRLLSLAYELEQAQPWPLNHVAQLESTGA